MSAVFKIVDTDAAMAPRTHNVDWSLCLLCQKSTSERLSDPEKNNRGDKYEGFRSLEHVLQSYESLGELSSLPFQINLSSLNDGTGLVNTFIKNSAKYHKSCKKCCSVSKLKKAEKRVHTFDQYSPVKLRRDSVPLNKGECIYCNGPATWRKALCTVQTLETSEKIKKYAEIFKDTSLQSKISGGHDVVAVEAPYHECCHAAFLNKIRAYENRKQECSSSLSEGHAYALAVLIAYMNEARDMDESGHVPVFRMTDLATMYAKIMKNLGFEHTPHTSRLRDRLLGECPYLMAVEGSPGQGIQITFRSDVDAAVRSSCRDYNADAFQFTEISKLIRSDIFESEGIKWDNLMGNQSASTPLSLKILLKMILRGPGSVMGDSKEQGEFEQVVDTLSQLICYHATKKNNSETKKYHHLKEREKPLPVYVAMKLYGKSRDKNLINSFHSSGLGISYDRLQCILHDKAAVLCDRFRQQNLVCPPNMMKNVFTIAAADNIDHNTSSTTSKTSFHGTAISLTQFPSQSSPGLPQEAVPFSGDDSLELPLSYSLVKPCFLGEVQSIQFPSSPNCTTDVPGQARCAEMEWLESCRKEVLPWAVYHSRKQDSVVCNTANSAVLPLFSEQAHSLAMMIHTFDIIIAATNHLNPSQSPVLVVDQPLYADCKAIQLLKPEKYGEKKIAVMMGGLHLEMAGWRAVGTFVEGSGLVGALVAAGVTTQGRAESMTKASHLTRTRYAHQVTAAVLYDLQRTAYDSYLETADEIPMTFEEWHEDRCKTIPQFKYWDLVLKLECLVLQFVRAERTADFKLYLESLISLVGWFFATNMVNYARWLPVHIRDLVKLRENHPVVADMFEAGFFVVQKTKRKFSSIAVDHSHEQLNAMLKGDGGMIGLTENPEALRKWLLTAPELAFWINEFEKASSASDSEEYAHHSDKESFIRRFQKDCSALKIVMEEMGSPFVEEGLDLYNIESKSVADEEAVTILRNIEDEGRKQYLAFVKERLETSTKKLSESIPQNRFSIWTTKRISNSKGKESALIKLLKSECSLFSTLFIKCQNMEYDLDEFFSYENQPYPPALSFDSQIRSCTKSDIIKCLLKSCSTDAPLASQDSPRPDVDAKYIDGAALVHMLTPQSAKTFQEYTDQQFLPYIRQQITASVKRIDIVWDTYYESSLKNTVREKRGSGNRLIVTENTKLPKKNWKNFLRDSENKTALFDLLAKSIRKLEVNGVRICSNSSNDLIVSPSHANTDNSGITPCNHEEADTRLILHVADGAKQGLTRAMIRTTDSDVLVLAVAFFPKIEELKELWVSIGTKQNHKIIAAHTIAASLGPDQSHVLGMFHAFTGCDTVSSFSGKGKVSTFETWQACPETTDGFLALLNGDMEEALPLIEKFVVALYDRTSDSCEVNECRRKLFTKGRKLDAMPPTKDALLQHCKRAAYQAGKVWGQCLNPMQDLPCPSECGWVRTDKTYQPVWTTLPLVQESLMIFLKCGCKTGCKPARCKCLKADRVCTGLCFCGGGCKKK